MVSWRYHQTVVRRLRIKGRRLDPLAAQLRLDNLLQTAELHPAWLPTSAIVCLRQLRDPLPRTLKLQNRTVPQSLVWQQAVSAAVHEKIRGAERPVNAQVSAEATAVIFKDQAELLACLAIDWAQGCLGSRWWWRSLFKDQDVAGLVTGAWLEAPQYVPAALELLAVKRGLKLFVGALSADRARFLLREVTRTFALPELQTALDAGFEEVRRIPAGDRIPGPRIHDASLAARARAMRSRPAAPWQQLVPESLDQAQGLERQCLIGVALTIKRGHAAARSSRFARATLSWLRAFAPDEIDGRRISSEPHPGAAVLLQEESRVNAQPEIRRLRSSIAPVDWSGHEALDSSVPEATQPDRNPVRLFAKKSSHPAPETGSQSRGPGVSSSSLEFDTTGGSERKAPSFSPIPSAGSSQEIVPGTVAQPSLTSNSPASADNESGAPPLAEELFIKTATNVLQLDEVRIDTEFGGVFYLINLGIFLELYSDFTAPNGKNLTLSIFDFVALLGERLMQRQIKDDPVWELLAQLGGRTKPDAPGEGFEPPDEWRLPAHWLEAFPDECQLEWMTKGERLRVKHPAGFLLLDIPLSDSPAKQLKREMMVYNANQRQLSHKSVRLSRSGSSLEQWLDWIVPYVCARLRRALGTADAAQLVCAQRASILSTDVQLEIFFDLSEHPLEIRLAGLDRDPGWVPAAGRFVRFHYQ
jgi:hypothetical protein